VPDLSFGSRKNVIQTGDDSSAVIKLEPFLEKIVNGVTDFLRRRR
jgi:hypothetical protein